MRRKRVLVAVASAVVAGAALGAQTLAEGKDEYVVYVDALNLRAEADANGARVKVLSRGDRVVNRSDMVTELYPDDEGAWYAEADYWRRVRAGDAEGWVNDRYIIPAAWYDAFAEADKAAREGSSRELFLLRVSDGIATAGLGGDNGLGLYADRPASVSPDREKAVVTGPWYAGNWGGGYPDGGRVESPFPAFVLVFGRGLVAYWRSYDRLYVWWSSDSRYCAVVGEPVAEYNLDAWWRVMDAATWDELGAGDCEAILSDQSFDYAFEFAGDYFLYFAREKDDRVAGAPFAVDPKYWRLPVVKGFDARTGESKRFLVAEPATLEKETAESFAFNGETHAVKMVPADAAPEAVLNSALYGRYNGRVAYALDVERAGE